MIKSANLFFHVFYVVPLSLHFHDVFEQTLAPVGAAIFGTQPRASTSSFHTSAAAAAAEAAEFGIGAALETTISLRAKFAILGIRTGWLSRHDRELYLKEPGFDSQPGTSDLIV
jgi:hypothetical protein